MTLSKRLVRLFTVLVAGVVLICSSGCITISTASYANSLSYTPVRSRVQIDASASVEATDTLSPEIRAIWKRWMNNDTSIANYISAAEQSLRNDLATSGLFARIVTNDSARADYHVKAECVELHPSDFRVRVTLTATETATGMRVSVHTREFSYGTSMFDVKWKEVMPGLMASLKADLASDLQEKVRLEQEQAARDEEALLTRASLSDLLASSDKTESSARARNRAIVAAKNQQLPNLLREQKTDELSSLVVKIEQTILDLNHECELAKDLAQQSVAGGEASRDVSSMGRQRGAPGDSGRSHAGKAKSLDELRGLAISYRERIELLKPILAALKEEIANRNR